MIHAPYRAVHPRMGITMMMVEPTALRMRMENRPMNTRASGSTPNQVNQWLITLRQFWGRLINPAFTNYNDELDRQRARALHLMSIAFALAGIIVSVVLPRFILADIDQRRLAAIANIFL